MGRLVITFAEAEHLSGLNHAQAWMNVWLCINGHKEGAPDISVLLITNMLLMHLDI